MLLHHNTHVHTFVGGTGAQRQLRRREPRPIGTFSLRDHPDRDGQQRAQASTSVNIPVSADTSPPTAPAGLTASASGARARQPVWAALDRRQRRQRLSGRALRGRRLHQLRQVATPTATTFADTAVVGLDDVPLPRARRRRVLTTSARTPPGADATTDDAPPTPPGLVGAWAFGEGSATTTADASGNGNTGALDGRDVDDAGPLRQRAERSMADQRVRVAELGVAERDHGDDAVGVDPADRRQSGWRTIMQREVDAYFLNASNSDGRAAPVGRRDLRPASQWDERPDGQPGQRLDPRRADLRRRDVAALRQRHPGRHAARTTGTIQTTTNPLVDRRQQPLRRVLHRAHRRGPRVQPRARPTEIQADMNTGIVPTAADTIPPSPPTG